MKKICWLCLFLCFLLVFQAGALPVLAVQTGKSAAEVSAEGETLPESGPDPALAESCKTIDGLRPLTEKADLLKTAKSALLFERNTGTILYAKDPDSKMFPASLTKVMTCLLVLENIPDLSQEIVVSDSALESVDMDAISANLQVGERISAQDLLYCLAVGSANDAGAVLAERVAGSEAEFVEMMNHRAQELGCTGTNFVNSHGLHDKNHYTTARDQAKILLAALENPKFRQLDSTAAYTVPATNLSEARELHTTNYLMSKENTSRFYDERVTGGKTGYTDAAGRCLISTAEEGDLSLLSVVMGAEETVEEDGYTISYYGSFEETQDLLDYGFEKFQAVQVTMEGQILGQYPVSGGENRITAGPDGDNRAILPVGYDKSKLSWQCQLSQPELAAPVAVGDSIGSCTVWYEDRCIAETGLVSLSRSEVRAWGEDIFTGSELQRENLGKILKIAGVVFLGVVVLLAVITAAAAVRNAVLRTRRRRRREAGTSRRSSAGRRK